MMLKPSKLLHSSPFTLTFALALAVVLGIAAALLITRESDVTSVNAGEERSANAKETLEKGSAPINDAAVSAERPAQQPATPQTDDEERRDEEEQKAVDDFDDETDKWMDPESTKPPKMSEINAYADKFKRLPDARKQECLQRALNLVPDENVMLIVGILMDKTIDKELVELVFNDILNRDEAVKKPILETIYRDRSHACWTDTAWILDVTGEHPVETQEKQP